MSRLGREQPLRSSRQLDPQGFGSVGYVNIP